MGTAPLSEQFLAHLTGASHESFNGVVDLEERLSTAIGAAREAHPAIEVDDEAFLQHLARHLADVEPSDGFEHLHAADLLLALGCARGDTTALAAFEAQLGPDIAAALRRFRNAACSEDDMRQVLQEKLFVKKADREPKIADYAGQGFLQNWLRITAVRTFTDMARQAGRTRETRDDELMRLADGEDLELSFLKKHYRAEFKQAFEAAVGGLDSGERNLLRHSVVRGLSIDQIAALYHIHRATAARRVAKARDLLLTTTQRELMHRLSIGREELDSLMQLIRSRLDVSIHRVLGSVTEHERAAGGEDG